MNADFIQNRTRNAVHPTNISRIGRLFSRGERSFTDSWCSLPPDHVNELVTLHSLLKETEERLHDLADESAAPYAKMKAAEIYKKFVTLDLNLELHDPVVLTEDCDEEYYVKDSDVVE